MYHETLEFVSLFFAGVLAGEELVVCYGVRAPVASLAAAPHIQLRQAMVRRLRVLVPVMFVSTAVSAAAVAALEGAAPGLGFRCAGVAALLTWILVTLFGTVPINEAVLSWQPNAPPKDWRARVRRWGALDTVRCWAAVIAFACFLTAAALRMSGI